jgi:hypothetical protein
LTEWINSQPFSSASRQPCGTVAIDEIVVEEVAKLVSSSLTFFSSSLTKRQKSVLLGLTRKY